MSTSQKESVARWLPLIVTILTNLILVAYGYGQLNQRIAPLEIHAAEALKTYVTRNEYTQQSLTRDREMVEIRADLRAIDAKLDRLLERQTRE